MFSYRVDVNWDILLILIEKSGFLCWRNMKEVPI